MLIHGLSPWFRCAQKESRLVTIDSSSESQFLITRSREIGHGVYDTDDSWTGAKVLESGEWVWDKGPCASGG